MKTDELATFSLDALSTITGGAGARTPEPYQTDENGVALPGDRRPKGVIHKSMPLIRFGKPDHPTPLPTPYIDGRPPFLHFN